MSVNCGTSRPAHFTVFAPGGGGGGCGCDSCAQTRCAQRKKRMSERKSRCTVVKGAPWAAVPWLRDVLLSVVCKAGVRGRHRRFANPCDRLLAIDSERNRFAEVRERPLPIVQRLPGFGPHPATIFPTDNGRFRFPGAQRLQTGKGPSPEPFL